MKTCYQTQKNIVENKLKQEKKVNTKKPELKDSFKSKNIIYF
jgi:hypothetical protein